MWGYIIAFGFGGIVGFVLAAILAGNNEPDFHDPS